ncbi:MAG: universal stress protein [Deltaproteobacteria bacterium]|nr:universal stress protein [Deltaproteobacteria bacterium]
MIKKILVPQDGSVHSKSALDYGLYLAKKFGAALTGMHVVDVVALEGPLLHDVGGSLGFEPFLNFSPKMRDALEERGRVILDGFTAECKAAGAQSGTRMGYGIIAAEICEAAKLADLVVMGSRGLNARFDYGLMGSTTEAVVRRSPEPVLVVPIVFKAPAHPLLAYDGSSHAAAAMHSAAEFCKALKLPLTVVTVSRDEHDSRLKDAEDYLLGYAIKSTCVHVRDETPLGIERYYKGHGHDLLFIGATRHSVILGMVLGSTAEHVMRHVAGPFFMER